MFHQPTQRSKPKQISVSAGTRYKAYNKGPPFQIVHDWVRENPIELHGALTKKGIVQHLLSASYIIVDSPSQGEIAGIVKQFSGGRYKLGPHDENASLTYANWLKVKWSRFFMVSIQLFPNTRQRDAFV